MSISTTDWPAQITLPGQAAAPEGPCDLWMMYVVHHAYRRDLRRFAAAVEHTPVADRAGWRALARRWELFAAALHHHHHGEDTALWPILAERTDDAGREVLAAMEAEHGEIDPILAAVESGLATLAAGGTEDDRAALLVRIVAGRARLSAHLGHEETDAITLMQQVMTEPEWLRVQQSAFKPDKITLVMVSNMIGWICDELPPAVRRRVLADTPGGRLLAAVSEPGFRRRERRAFRHVPAAELGGL